MSRLLFQIPIVEHAMSSRQQLDLGPPGNESFTLLEHLDGMPMRRTHHRHANLGPPMKVAITGLGDSHLEAPPQFGNDRPNDGPLLLQ
jgi:hypothetical protein